MHSWNLTIAEAIQLQKLLREQIHTRWTLERPRLVAGADVAYEPRSRTSVAAVTVLSLPGLVPVASSIARIPTPFPYVPGLLSFRETPALLKAFQGIHTPPDLVLVDGHGMAHPRRFGLACHLGLWLNLPTIGIAKTKLCGEFSVLDRTRGSRADLISHGERIGLVLRTRIDVKPVFVSVGYGLPLEACADWTLQLAPRYRLPEPIRQADRLASSARWSN